MKYVFVQIRCRPGTTYQVADAIYLREQYLELYSTSGAFDLLLKINPPPDGDVGKYINDNVHDIDGVERTLTTPAFQAFHLPDNSTALAS